MFLPRYPSPLVIDRFVRGCRGLPLSYGEPIGLLGPDSPGYVLDDATVQIGQGEEDFARARTAVQTWKPFDVGWVHTFPRHAPLDVGTDVAVLFRHLGFWSLNGCRILY